MKFGRQCFDTTQTHLKTSLSMGARSQVETNISNNGSTSIAVFTFFFWKHTTPRASRVARVARWLFGHEISGDPKATNHLGKPHRIFDEAGVVGLQAYDFKGNVLEKTREVIAPQKMIDAVGAADSANNFVVDTFRVDWTPVIGETLADRKASLIDDSPYRTAYSHQMLTRDKARRASLRVQTRCG